MRRKTCVDPDRIKEFCGLFGISGNPEASWLTYLGLYALQHRGEESCGIVSSDGEEVYMHKGMGQVCDVFNEEKLRTLKGSLAIGHVRYSTTGSSLVKNAQPLFVDYSGSYLAIGHNGNLINSFTLKKELEDRGSIFQTTCDSEVIIHLMARAKSDNLIDKLLYALKKIKGAYSLVLMAENKLIGVRDPLGFRPLSLGKINGNWCIASETCAFDLTEAEFIRDIEPGEVVIIDKDKIESVKFSNGKSKCAQCIFEQVYFSRPDSIVFGKTVHMARQEFGKMLAKEHPVKADIVVPVPDSGTSAALGFSKASGIPLEQGVIRNHYIGRTFIQPHQGTRDFGVRVKFNVLKEVVKGKRVVIVDDSIVRGTTSRIRIHNFRKAGAKEVHLRISCPPHKFPCYYGIDFPRQEELLAHNYSMEEIRKFMGVDSLGYLSLEGMLNSVKPPTTNYCTACWTGDYPLIPEKIKGKYILEKCGAK